ncbi:MULTISPECIES: branched-chain amino acid aminotransferase [unclassified Corynebacterium]|uniref:branched-chain amino acid aminotransferase n=1 Tax=unclassified Corynebacterium TaxID=2624378 RepID=UPI00352458B4
MSSLTFEVTRNENPTSAERRTEILADPGFGRSFTDHMVTIEWTAEKGWHDARVRPYGPLSLDPSTSVLHYGQAIFEGLKAYRHADGSIRSFRPHANAERLQQSAARMAMPELPVDVFVESVRQLVDIDRDWVPTAGGEEALYLRPFMIATESTLGVHPSNSYTYAVIASPAGAYFRGGVNPVSVWLCEDFVRACPGGTGAAKFAGNYAASLKAQAQAAEKGCDQVVWLDAIEHSYVEEMGGMNLFFVYGDGDAGPGEITVATPALSGSLLPGVTRRSLLQVAKDQGFRTEEVRISTEQWRSDAASGRLREVFACGTAAVITPVGHVKSNQGDFDIAGGESGEITMKLREILTGIQKGEIEDTHGWLYTLVE